MAHALARYRFRGPGTALRGIRLKYFHAFLRGLNAVCVPRGRAGRDARDRGRRHARRTRSTAALNAPHVSSLRLVVSDLSVDCTATSQNSQRHPTRDACLRRTRHSGVNTRMH